MATILLDKLSRSSSSMSSKEGIGEESFKWDSVKIYLYFAFTLSSSLCNEDIFSKLRSDVSIIDFLALQMIVGMSYASMDFFIKQYTGKIDFNTFLNPLLRGITLGIFLQSASWAVLHSTEISDAWGYYMTSLSYNPSWSNCDQSYGNHCVSNMEILKRCRQKKVTEMNRTSAFMYFRKHSHETEKSQITGKIFIIAVVWIMNFFLATVTATTLLKLLKLTFFMKIISTIFILVLVITMSENNEYRTAFSQIMNFKLFRSYRYCAMHIAPIYNIGLLGVYDFGTMSPYTMTDNAVIIFSVIVVIWILLKSTISRTIYLIIKPCVKLQKRLMPDELLFMFCPLGTEFLHAQKLILSYMFLHYIFAIIGHLALITATMARILNTEFRKVKELYIVGVLCFLGFILSGSLCSDLNLRHPLKRGVFINMYCLGILKSCIVMWIYGVKRFATDMEFWLGVRPAFFWIVLWALLPITLSYSMSLLVADIYAVSDARRVATYTCIGVTVAAVVIMQLKTISHHMVHSNLGAAFRSSAKYGPPDADVRKKRRKYSEITRFLECEHNCTMLDDRLDCLHEPIMFKTEPSKSHKEPKDKTSLTDIFHEKRTRRASSAIDIETLRRD